MSFAKSCVGGNNQTQLWLPARSLSDSSDGLTWVKRIRTFTTNFNFILSECFTWSVCWFDTCHSVSWWTAAGETKIHGTSRKPSPLQFHYTTWWHHWVLTWSRQLQNMYLCLFLVNLYMASFVSVVPTYVGCRHRQQLRTGFITAARQLTLLGKTPSYWIQTHQSIYTCFTQSGDSWALTVTLH